MNFDEWHEQAGREAYAAFNKTRVYATVAFDDLNELDQEAWREVARAVLAEGKIEVRPSAELTEEQTRDENERLIKIARERAEDAQSYRDAADELKSKLAGLRRAYDHACAQRDKYMRRTAEWRSAAVDGWDLPEDILADMQWAVNEVGQTHRDNCDEAEDECGICKRFAEMKERYPDADDGVRACTGCGKCNVCRKKTDEPYRGPLATQGPNDNCKSGCHNYAWHCGRCGGCTGYQWHHWPHCKVTGTVREFHMCCPDDCELPASDEGQ